MKELRTIKIKKGNTIFEADRNDLINCDETADGISLQFKNGIIFQYDNVSMVSGSKNLIKNTIDRMVNGNIFIDLDNLSNPITFTAI